MILYQPQTALLLNYPTEFDKRQPVGENPPPGAMIDYYLKSAPKDEVTLDILDAKGQLVRHLSSKEKKESEQPPEWPDRVESAKTIPAAEGMNRFPWDLRYEDPVKTPGAFYSGEGPRGPKVLPGDYQMKLTRGRQIADRTLAHRDGSARKRHSGSVAKTIRSQHAGARSHFAIAHRD